MNPRVLEWITKLITLLNNYDIYHGYFWCARVLFCITPHFILLNWRKHFDETLYDWKVPQIGRKFGHRYHIDMSVSVYQCPQEVALSFFCSGF